MAYRWTQMEGPSASYQSLMHVCVCWSQLLCGHSMCSGAQKGAVYTVNTNPTYLLEKQLRIAAAHVYAYVMQLIDTKG